MEKRIFLNLYRYLPEYHDMGADDQAGVDCNYTPYKIFVLESRLYPEIYKLKVLKDKNVFLYPSSIFNQEKNRMDVYLNITDLKDDTQIYLSNEDKKNIEDKLYLINSVNPEYALINIKELYNGITNIKYPFSWFRSLIEYTGLDSSFNPFIKEEGIYLTFNPNSDYKTAYANVCSFLVERIGELYNLGAVILEKKNDLIEKWNLTPFDFEEVEKRIYVPRWEDERFAENKVDFLLRKITGDPYIRLLLPDNLVQRHAIISSCQEKKKALIVEGSYIKLPVSDLQEAREIADLFETKTIGRVIILAATRLSEIYLYFQYAEKFKLGDCISYSVSDRENPYLFSCLLSDRNYMPTETLQERFRNYATDRLIEVSKISKLKNMSPHRIIEEEFTREEI